MSTKSNQAMMVWKDVWAKLRRNTYKIDIGIIADKDQQLVIADGYLLSICVWSDLCGTLPVSTLMEMTSLLCHETVSDVINRYSDLDNLLIQGLSEVDYVDFIRSHFKRVTEVYPHSGKWTWLLTKTLVLLSGTCDSDVSVFKTLHQIFTFISRLTIPGRQDLMDEAETSFLQQEIQLGTLYPLVGLPLQEIMNNWFPNTIDTYERLYSNWIPGHGNGSVAEGNLDIGDKYHELRRDDRLDDLDTLTGGLGYPRFIPKGLDRTAKVQFVPKNASKLRTICMEPATLQFYQQGCFRSLNGYICSHPYLRRRIDLRHPEINSEWARVGSIDGSMATIDLSSASDSVSWSLVRSAFDGTPLLPMLEATRSDYECLPSGRRFRTRKFAPMGSALCFPIECIVFCSIVEYAIKQVGGSPKHSHYCVYGDDIVVETKWALPVITALLDFGFTVNTNKSYYTVSHLNFRESCGGEYVLGEDVAPVKIPRNFRGIDKTLCLADADRYEGLIDLANRLRPISPTGRRIIIQCLNNLPRWARPKFVAIGENGGIQSDTATNFRLECRRFVDPQVTPNNRYQRTMYRHGCRKHPVGTIIEEDEDIRLYECLRAMAVAPDSDLIDRDGDTFIDHLGRDHTARRLTSRWS